MNSIEVDRTRVKPVVKITGEFWAQTTEGDGNFHMFDFLEREGAQVLVEPIATWVAYLLYQAKYNAVPPQGRRSSTTTRKKWERRDLRYRKKVFGLAIGECHVAALLPPHQPQTRRASRHDLAPQKELDRAGQSVLQPASRAAAKATSRSARTSTTPSITCAHMVLALKPFGCMPSSQSDGVQSAVINHFKDMIFLPIETSGEGEVNAHSRVQMALGEAKAKARLEFEQCSEVRPASRSRTSAATSTSTLN